MQSHFSICVSHRGKHWFATAPHSLTEKTKAYEMLLELQTRFPEDQGFRVTMTYWESIGHPC